jgi:hypothetical protein
MRLNPGENRIKRGILIAINLVQSLRYALVPMKENVFPRRFGEDGASRGAPQARQLLDATEDLIRNRYGRFHDFTVLPQSYHVNPYARPASVRLGWRCGSKTARGGRGVLAVTQRVTLRQTMDRVPEGQPPVARRSVRAKAAG